MATEDIPVIAVDGPGGAGKGTVCQALAAQLDWHLLDSGALYRLVALDAMRAGIDLDDEAGVTQRAQRLDVVFATDGRISLAGDDVSEAIRSEGCSQGASRVAALPAVRTALIDRQRAFCRPPGLVADGRDMGSVVFPGARLKVFLTASVEERARRRYKQLKDKGIDVSLARLSEELGERDRRDAARAVAPLKAAPDAWHLDTTGLSIDAVVAQVMSWAVTAFPELNLPGKGME
ncbi:MAG: (d)CMP kinase [Chromatiales bacterium]|nr:MAG: (d)CMP kinase [Chromatiales bacterium]